jgi:PAS domain S-box-containing protein
MQSLVPKGSAAMNYDRPMTTLEQRMEMPGPCVESNGRHSTGSAPGLECAPGACGHLVQFYEDDGFLVQSLRRFIGSALTGGAAALVIATPEHRAALEVQLARDGHDLAQAGATGRYSALDAAETLSGFCSDNGPDPERFREILGAALQRAASGGRPVRAFGEMVAILWQQHRYDAAIRLEQLWNVLAQEHSLALLCAYPISGFAGHAHAGLFADICQQHSSIIPGESYAALPSDRDRDHHIALLQQKAAALEAEVKARRQSEDLLRQRERELSDFLENAVEGLHRVGPDGTILWANRAELQMLGYQPHEYIGRHIAEFHLDQAVIQDILARLLAGETLYNYPARMRARDGSVRHVLIHSNGQWHGGQLRSTRCFTRDITEQVLAQEQRDALLAAEQDARAELQRANDDLKDFAYIVSHDLKEPLRGISNYASFLLKDHAPGIDADALAKIETIQRLARRSYDLLDAVLAFSRIGREQIRIEPIAVERLFARAFDNVRGRIDDEGALVTFEPTALTVDCDPDLALQVLTNLITNGLKYNGSPTKRIEVRCTAGAGGTPLFSITDNGIGIEARHQESIFRMFKRLHGRDRYGGGTGAGLAIVRRIVERHGGRIWVESEVGRGSTFFFTLAPLAQPAERPSPAATAS